MMSTPNRWVGSMPAIYDELVGPVTFVPPADALAAHIAGIGPRRILELAAGTGILTARLPAVEIVATDLNPAMVEYAAARVPGARWQVADATALDFPDGAFDLVACQFGVMFFPNRVHAYAGIRRVLAPGGAFVFNTWDVLERHTLEDALIAELADEFPDDPPDFLRRTPHGYADPTVIGADLVAAGFEVVALDRVSYRGVAPSAAGVARGYCLGTPLRFQLERLGDVERIADRAAERMTARFGRGEVESELGVHLVDARNPTA